MALQQVNFGSASDGSQGDTARAAFGKINANFSDTTNAASRLVGTAAGQVMEVGAFGMGAEAAPTVADPNALRAGGMYQITVDVASSIGLPLALGHTILHCTGANSASGSHQFASPLTSVSTNKNRLWHRQCFSGVWSPFQEIAYLDLPSFLTETNVNSFSATAGGSPSLITTRYRGSQAAPSAVLANDRLSFNVSRSYASDGGIKIPFAMEVYASEDHTASAQGCTFVIATTKTGSNGRSNALRINGAGVVELPNGSVSSAPVRVGQYTLSTLPAASAWPGYEIDVTDAAGGAKRCRSDGTNWKILNTTTTVS